ncbi:putative polysaccharide biosynthesis protein [Amphibacillus jilinensis]|uniref:putative polysaccharide biosynthesis protein n=1 Tax=Amphibacillus jilinensis TaxID=1216008 RepID=UPI0002EA9A2D|nr:polysaccharide biosynthesis protein [Amphibacillus jilinensis]
MDEKFIERRQLFRGAFLLTYAGLLSKVLSAGYRIPLQNITGDVGFYVYQQIYPFIGTATVLALYGFPAAISRLVTNYTGHLPKKLKRLIFIQLAFFSLTIFAVIYILAPIIAQAMGDQGLTNAIKVSGCVFLLTPFISSLRGQFQGENNMVPTAASQVVEQVIRVSLIIGAAAFITQFNRSLYDVGTGAALASISGAMGAVIILLIYKKRYPDKQPVEKEISTSARHVFSTIIGYGIVMAVNHMLLLLLQFIDALTLVPQLVDAGISLHEAQTLKGILDRGQPLAQLGIVIASSLTLALIPSVTKARLSKDQERFSSYISSTWRFTLYLASAATAGLIVLFPEINSVLFLENTGTFSLQLFMLTIIFASLAISTAAILQGLDHIFRTALFVLVGVVVKLLLNLLFIPVIDISGAALATVIATVVVLGLNLIQLKKAIPHQKLIDIPWKSFSLSLILMIVVVFGLNRLINPLFSVLPRSGQFLYILLFVILGVFVYFKALTKQGAFTDQELDVLPLKRFLKKG